MENTENDYNTPENDNNVPRVVPIEKSYWDMTPEEKVDWVTDLLNSFSPNEEVRNKSK